MNNFQLTHIPVAKAEMLIRKPVAEVFEAFINPEITTRFWFTKSSGRLDAGKQVTWTWEMYNASSQVTVREVEQNKRILIEWSGYGSPNTVEWIFTPYGDELVKQALDSTSGFTMVLAGLKAFLEHAITLNLVLDRFPKDLREH